MFSCRLQMDGPTQCDHSVGRSTDVRWNGTKLASWVWPACVMNVVLSYRKTPGMLLTEMKLKMIVRSFGITCTQLYICLKRNKTTKSQEKNWAHWKVSCGKFPHCSRLIVSSLLLTFISSIWRSVFASPTLTRKHTYYIALTVTIFFHHLVMLRKPDD